MEMFLRALRLAPRDVDAHLTLGRALVAQEHFGDAIGVCERAVRLDEERAESHVLLADAIRSRAFAEAAGSASDDVSRAVAHYERALRIDASASAEEAYRGLARIHLHRGEHNAALAMLERGLAAITESPSASLLIDMAALLLQRADSAAAQGDDANRALRVLRAALNVRPRDVRASRLLIEALERDAAAADLVGAWLGLGIASQEIGDLAGAANAFERAIALKADCLRAWLRLADIRLALGQPDAAVRCLDAAVAIDPEHPTAHVNLGWALRTAGDLARGWQESAWHYRAGDKRRFEQPAWDGATLGTRAILLWADFALGDTIHDLRYLPLIRAAHPHARIILEVDRRLVSLIERHAAASQQSLADVVIAFKAPLLAFDVHLPLRRLPEVLGIDLASIPANVPYLALAPEEARGRVETKPSHVKTIGIVWAGDQTRADARIKSASLADFEPLLALSPQVRFISLQLGPTVDELIALPPGLQIDRVLDDGFDVARTAMVMGALDLIITVDTMTAHLAGALGKEVWVLAAFAPAWWLWHVDGASRSLWYPTMRIFRQRRASDWPGVIQDIRAALHAHFTLP